MHAHISRLRRCFCFYFTGRHVALNTTHNIPLKHLPNHMWLVIEKFYVNVDQIVDHYSVTARVSTSITAVLKLYTRYFRCYTVHVVESLHCYTNYCTYIKIYKIYTLKH